MMLGHSRSFSQRIYEHGEVISEGSTSRVSSFSPIFGILRNYRRVYKQSPAITTPTPSKNKAYMLLKPTSLGTASAEGKCKMLTLHSMLNDRVQVSRSTAVEGRARLATG